MILIAFPVAALVVGAIAAAAVQTVAILFGADLQ